MTQYILKIIRTSCPEVHNGEVLTEFYMPGKNTISASYSPGTNMIPELYTCVEDVIRAKHELQKKLDQFRLKLMLNNQVLKNTGINETLLIQELFATIAVWDYVEFKRIQDFNSRYIMEGSKKIRVADKMKAKADRYLAIKSGEINYIGNEEIDSI